MTVQTQLNERELAQRIHDTIEAIYSIVIRRRHGDSEADKRVAVQLEALSNLVDKLKFANVKRLSYDAQINAKNEKALEQLEEISREIITGEKFDIRAADYLKGVAKRFKRSVSRTKHKAEREREKKLIGIEKKEKALKKQKKQIQKTAA